MYEDEMISVNSEVRYISLELMKIASKEKRSFDEVASEYIRNVYHMHCLIKKGRAGDFINKKATSR